MTGEGGISLGRCIDKALRFVTPKSAVGPVRSVTFAGRWLRRHAANDVLDVALPHGCPAVDMGCLREGHVGRGASAKEELLLLHVWSNEGRVGQDTPELGPLPGAGQLDVLLDEAQPSIRGRSEVHLFAKLLHEVVIFGLLALHCRSARGVHWHLLALLLMRTGLATSWGAEALVRAAGEGLPALRTGRVGMGHVGP